MDYQVFEKKREEDLRERAVQGDRSALSLLLESHQGWMRSFALRLEGNVEDGQDLLQDVYIKILENLASFKGRSALKTWLYRLMVNTYLDGMRKRKKVQTSLPGTLPEARQRDPLGREISNETFQKVQEALTRLPPKQRAVITLRIYEELSYKEISGILGISLGAVKMNVVYARQKLAKLLGSPLH